MRKIEINAYEYEELEENVKQKLLEKEKQTCLDIYYDYDLQYDMEGLAKNLLEEHFKGATFNYVYYDLSYSQGSGAMIEFTITLQDINNKYKMLTKNEMERIESVGYTDIAIKQCGRYYHEKSFTLDYQDYTYYLENFEKTQEKLDNLMDTFKNDIVEMNEELSNEGYKLLEQDFEEYALCNLTDKLYYKNGNEFIESELV